MPSISTESVDLIVHARWVLGAHDSHALLDEHCVVVKGERIVDVLPSDEATKLYNAGSEISLAEHILMPGMVNAHGHAAMSLLPPTTCP